jgi:dienelactone hydrolase
MNVLDGEVPPEVDWIMAISFECEGCGKEYTVRDELAGKTGQCKQCGHQMTIPSDRDADGYGLESPPPPPEPEAIPDSAMLPPRKSGWATRPANGASPGSFSGMNPPSAFDPPSPRGFNPPTPKKSFFSFGGKEQGGAFAAVFFVVMLVVRVYFKWDRGQNRNANNGQQNAMAPRNNFNNNNAGANFSPFVDRTGPIRLPRFPDPGPGQEIEPGITLHEIKLGPPRIPPGSLPGYGGKLWLYLPSGEHPAKSLPCVLITGAGSNLLSGMDLADGDRPEHLPYVRAGFAVLAFELDGSLQNKQNASAQERVQAMFTFLNARAGLVNAHIALEYVLAKVPQVDPQRISAAGHSSAGTLAVLFAENEPRLKACVAFAPALDLEERFGADTITKFKKAGVADLAVLYSPKNNEDKLKVPLFLFHAQDDSNLPFGVSQTFADELKAKGKPVTLDLVATGDHYDSMINEGIPHAIAWLNEQGAGPSK